MFLENGEIKINVDNSRESEMLNCVDVMIVNSLRNSHWHSAIVNGNANLLTKQAGK